MEVTLKNETVVTIKEARKEDTQIILDYMNQIHYETKNLTREPDEFNMTFDQEYSFLKNVEESPDQVMLIALDNGRVISTAGIHGSSLKRLKHRVSLGISIVKAYRSMGLGNIMMRELLKHAKQMQKRKVELEVRIDNKIAINLYKKLGFKEEGIKREGFYVDGKYVDILQMGLFLEESI